MDKEAGNKCSKCGKNIRGFPFKCKYCGEDHCDECRLPEDHNCIGLENKKKTNKEKWVETFKTFSKHSKKTKHKSYKPKTATRGMRKLNLNFPSLRKYKKYLPLLGLVLLLILYLYMNQPSVSVNNAGNISSSINQNMKTFYQDFTQSFNFSNKI